MSWYRRPQRANSFLGASFIRLAQSRQCMGSCTSGEECDLLNVSQPSRRHHAWARRRAPCRRELWCLLRSSLLAWAAAPAVLLPLVFFATVFGCLYDEALVYFPPQPAMTSSDQTYWQAFPCGLARTVSEECRRKLDPLNDKHIDHGNHGNNKL